MLRIRTSTLERFRRLCQTEWESEIELVDYIRAGQESDAPSWQAAAGTAWHKVISQPDWCLQKGDPNETCYQSGDYFFRPEAVELALAHLGPGPREVTGYWGAYLTDPLTGDCHSVCVEGTADQLSGLVVQDDKTKFTTADPSDYFDSLQWRFYLLIHKAACFRYNLWSFKDPTDAGFCELKGVDSFRLWPYPGMEAECVDWVRNFIGWAGAKNLFPALQQRRGVAT